MQRECGFSRSHILLPKNYITTNYYITGRVKTAILFLKGGIWAQSYRLPVYLPYIYPINFTVYIVVDIKLLDSTNCLDKVHIMNETNA